MLRIFSLVATDYAIEFWLGTKVENEPELEIGRLEVVVKLSSRGLVEFRGRFRLYDKPFVYNQVESLGAEFLPFVKDVNSYFPRDPMPSLQKLPFQRHHVEPLEKPKSEVVVNLVKGSNNRMSELPFVEFNARHKQKKPVANPHSIIKPGPQTPIARND